MKEVLNQMFKDGVSYSEIELNLIHQGYKSIFRFYLEFFLYSAIYDILLRELNQEVKNE